MLFIILTVVCLGCSSVVLYCVGSHPPSCAVRLLSLQLGEMFAAPSLPRKYGGARALSFGQAIHFVHRPVGVIKIVILRSVQCQCCRHIEAIQGLVIIWRRSTKDRDRTDGPTSVISSNSMVSDGKNSLLVAPETALGCY